MMPITKFLTCTEPLNTFDSLSYHRTNHAKAFVSGLIAAHNKTIEGIPDHVMPSASDRALNKLLGEYDWQEEQLNLERLAELQRHGETRWSQKGYVVIDDSFTHKTGEEIPNVGRFYDHADGEYIWGSEPLGFADCEAQRSTSARRHWQLVMLAYSLARLAPVRSADDGLSRKATSLRTEWEYSLKESIYNVISWIREQRDRAITEIMAEFDDLFKNVRS